MPLHRRNELTEIAFLRAPKINRNIDIVHAKFSNDLRLIIERVFAIAGQQIDDLLKTRFADRAKLFRRGLAR